MPKSLNDSAEYPCQLAALSTFQTQLDEIYDERLYRVKCGALMVGTIVHRNAEYSSTDPYSLGCVILKSLCRDCPCKAKIEDRDREDVKHGRRECK